MMGTIYLYMAGLCAPAAGGQPSPRPDHHPGHGSTGQQRTFSISSRLLLGCEISLSSSS